MILQSTLKAVYEVQQAAARATEEILSRIISRIEDGEELEPGEFYIVGQVVQRRDTSDCAQAADEILGAIPKQFDFDAFIHATWVEAGYALKMALVDAAKTDNWDNWQAWIQAYWRHFQIWRLLRRMQAEARDARSAARDAQHCTLRLVNDCRRVSGLLPRG